MLRAAVSAYRDCAVARRRCSMLGISYRLFGLSGLYYFLEGDFDLFCFVSSIAFVDSFIVGVVCLLYSDYFYFTIDCILYYYIFIYLERDEGRYCFAIS